MRARVRASLVAVLQVAAPALGQQAHVNLDGNPHENTQGDVGGDGGHDWGTWRAHLACTLPRLWRKM